MGGHRVILVGATGVGKTTIRHPLAERLGVRSLGPDDFPNRWDDIYWQMDRYPFVLECCMIPRAVRKRLDGRETIVELVAAECVRHERLVLQGIDADTIQQRLSQATGRLGYQDAIIPHLTLDTSGAAMPLVDEIADFVRSRGARSIYEHTYSASVVRPARW
jgi:hypothetical protein